MIHFLFAPGEICMADTLTEKQRETGKKLLERAGVSVNVISMCADDNALRVALETVADCHWDVAPDTNWFKEYFSVTSNRHMVLTDEGWLPAEYNTVEHTGTEPMEVLDEVNIPA